MQIDQYAEFILVSGEIHCAVGSKTTPPMSDYLMNGTHKFLMQSTCLSFDSRNPRSCDPEDLVKKSKSEYQTAPN